MPAISGSDLDLMRSGPPQTDYFLAIIPKQIVIAASVNDAAIDYGDTAITYDNITQGSWGSIWAGQTLLVYDSTGTVYKGKVRVRSAAATTLTVAANWDIEWENNDLLQVVNWFEPWPVPTHMVDSESGIIYYKDTDIEYTTQAAMFPPKANGGVAQAIFAGNGTADVQFDASDSDAMCPGASISTYLWHVEDGAYQVGNQNSAAITVRFPIGFRYIHLTVTDDNGETGIHHIPVWVFGSSYQPVRNFELRRRSYERRDAQVAFECFETDLGELDIAQGAGICLFSRTYVNGTEVTADFNCPFPDRWPVKLTGWIMEDTIRYDPQTGTVTFTAATVGKVADLLDGFGTFLQDPDYLESLDSPESWHDADDLTVRMACYFLLRWHTTLTQICHIEFFDYSTDNTPSIAGREFTVAPPLKQLEASLLNERGVFARIGCSRWGSIHFRMDPRELDDSDRAARAKVMHLNKTDLFSEMQFKRVSRPRVSSILGGGIHYDGASGTPYRARSPGRVGRHAGRKMRVDKLIISGQDDLNDVLGRHLAAVTNEWSDVPLETLWDVWEPALQEYVTFDADAAQNPREFGFDATSTWITRRLEIEDRPGDAPIVTQHAELLTDGFAGVTVEIPEPPTYPNPPRPSPRPRPGPAEPAPPPWVSKMYVATPEGIYYGTGDFEPNANQPTWSTAMSGIPALGTMRAILLDPFDNVGRQYSLLRPSGGGAQDYALYRRVSQGSWSKLFDGFDADTLIGDGDDYWIKDMSVDPLNDGTIWLLAGPAGTVPGSWSCYALKNTNYGTAGSWTAHEVDSHTLFYEAIMIHAMGSLVVVTERKAAGGRPFWVTSRDGGGTWNESTQNLASTTFDSYVWFSQIETLPLLSGRVSGDASDTDLLQALSGDENRSVIKEDQCPETFHGVWQSAVDTDFMRMCLGQRAYTTYDKWASQYQGPVHKLGHATREVDIAMVSAPHERDEEKLYIGCELTADGGISWHPNTVYVSDDNTATVWKKAGANADTPPYTDSIPGSDTGIARYGIQPVVEVE